jgi:spermidine synthase
VSVSNLEILACEQTALGLICLRRRELLSRPGTVVTEITLDHELLMSSYITGSERALARSALELHPGTDLRVLIGGLGLGYTAREALAAEGGRAGSVVVVEYLPEVIRWLDAGLVPLAPELKSDPRLSVEQGDVFARLAGVPERLHDLILIDVDHSPDEHLGSGSSGFYSEAGLRSARRHLAEGGVLGVWSYAEHSPFSSALSAVFGNVVVEPVTVFNDLVDEEQTDWLFFARD